MKLTIKSKQDYGTHVEEFDEEMECIKSSVNGNILLTFQEGNIEIEDKKITYIRGENVMEIEENSTTEFEMVTEAGIIKMEIEGILVERTNNEIGLLAKTRYKLLLESADSYVNELEIYYE